MKRDVETKDTNLPALQKEGSSSPDPTIPAVDEAVVSSNDAKAAATRTTETRIISRTLRLYFHREAENIFRFSLRERVVISVALLVLIPLFLVTMMFVAYNTSQLFGRVGEQLSNASKNMVERFDDACQAYDNVAKVYAAQWISNQGIIFTDDNHPLIVGVQNRSTKESRFAKPIWADYPILDEGVFQDPFSGDVWLCIGHDGPKGRITTVFDLSVGLTILMENSPSNRIFRLAVDRQYVYGENLSLVGSNVDYTASIPTEMTLAFLLPHRAFPESEQVFQIKDAYTVIGSRDYRLRAFAGVNMGDLADSIVKFRAQAASVALVTYLLAVLVAIMISGLFSSPVIRLSKHIENLRGNNIKSSVPFDYKWDDEIGDLTSSINKITDDLRTTFESLERGHDELEKTVSDRTQELKDALRRLADVNDHLQKLVSEQAETLVESQKRAILATLVHGLTHNLKNPLSSLRGYIQLMETAYEERLRRLERLPENQRKFEEAAATEEMSWISIMHDSCDKTIDIVYNILDRAAARESGKQVFIDINSLIRREILFLESDLFFKHQIEKSLEFAPDLPPFYGNYSEISQVVENLLQNAREAMQDSMAKQLTVSTTTFAEHLIIRISDTGEGMTPEVKANIFTQYFSTKRNRGLTGGTGLGLYTCLETVNRYKGRIEVDSVPGKGATFTVFLPITEHGV